MKPVHLRARAPILLATTFVAACAAPWPVRDRPPAHTDDTERVSIAWETRREGRLLSRLERDVVQLRGGVNGVMVDLDWDGAVLTGHVGWKTVSIWTLGQNAWGTVGGHPVGFVLVPTARGHLLRGYLPAATVRVELADRSLSWFPGCGQPLQPEGTGALWLAQAYEGVCTDGSLARLHLRPLAYLRPFPGLLVLALVLTDRDPVFADHDLHLFPRLGDR